MTWISVSYLRNKIESQVKLCELVVNCQADASKYSDKRPRVRRDRIRNIADYAGSHERAKSNTHQLRKYGNVIRCMAFQRQVGIAGYLKKFLSSESLGPI